MSLDPEIVAAAIGVVAVLLSAVVSYFVAQRIEDRKSTIEYLKGKVTALEEKKRLLVGLGFEDLGDDITKDNFIERYKDMMSRKFSVSVQNFRHVDHYFAREFLAQLQPRIQKLTLALGAEGMESIAERQIPADVVGDIPRGQYLRNEMSGVADTILRALDDELQQSIESLEKLSGLKQ